MERIGSRTISRNLPVNIKSSKFMACKRKACCCVLSWRSTRWRRSTVIGPSNASIAARIQNLERENEQQRAKMVRKGHRVQSLRRSLLTLRAECWKLNSRLDAAERDNGHLRADLRKDAGEFRRMRDSMRGLRHRALDCGENMIS